MIVKTKGNKELYKLTVDPYEGNKLLNRVLTPADENTKTTLETALLEIRNE